MAQNATEFEFVLNDPIEIHKDGSLVPTTKLLLKAPSNVHRYYLIKLKQGFMKAMMGLAKYDDGDKKKLKHKVENEGEKGTIDAKFIMPLLLSSDIDFYEYMSVFKDFLCSNVCFVERSIPMTSHLFDQISLEDTEFLLGKYIENFLLSSWTKNLNQK